MDRLARQFRFRRKNDRGASAVEYGLMVAAIAAVIVGVVFGFGGIIRDAFTTTSTCITLGANAGSPPPC